MYSKRHQIDLTVGRIIITHIGEVATLHVNNVRMKSLTIQTRAAPPMESGRLAMMMKHHNLRDDLKNCFRSGWT